MCALIRTGASMIQLLSVVVVALIATSVFTDQVHAGSVKKTYVKRIQYADQCDNSWNGCVFVTFSNSVRQAPACQRFKNRMIVDPNGPGAPNNHAELLRALERAYQYRMPVQVSGFGTCLIHGNTETLKSVKLLEWRPPKPKDGVDGRDGKDGKQGKDGKPGSRIVSTCHTYLKRFSRGSCSGRGELITKTTGKQCSVGIEGGYGCSARVVNETDESAICCAYRVE